jgi:hypothetical protein
LPIREKICGSYRLLLRATKVTASNPTIAKIASKPGVVLVEVVDLIVLAGSEAGVELVVVVVDFSSSWSGTALVVVAVDLAVSGLEVVLVAVVVDLVASAGTGSSSQ